MRPIRVFFYIDSGAMISHCVTAAELIRKQLGAHIIMMLVDSEKHLDETMKSYEVYDYGSLFSFPKRFAPVWPAAGEKEKRGRRLFGLLRSRSALAASERIGVQSKMVQVIVMSPLFILIMPYLILRFARNNLWRLRRAVRTRVRKILVDPFRRSQAGQLSLQLFRLLLVADGVKQLLRAIEPDVIILPEDNVETLSTIFVAKGRARSIPSIIIPFTIPNPLEPARYYVNNPLYQAKGPFARLLTAYYPKWRIQHEGKDLLRQPAIKALCLEMLGLSSPAPWILNRGGAVNIALDSEAQRDLYLKLEFPAAQLRVIGDVNGEVFHRNLNDRGRLVDELRVRHGLQPGRPLILCGFPPDQYEGTDTSRFEFANYDALIEAWMGSFRALGKRANVLVRPHPRVPFDRLVGFEDSNIKFTLQPTAELISLCDLYVASISATIRWAIACGIPVINYDTFRYRYTDYDSAAGVIGVEKLDEFRALIAHFVDDPVFAADLAERQRSVMKYWGVLDDRAAERLSALVVEAVSHAGRLRPN
jgi:hypothetical protein